MQKERKINILGQEYDFIITTAKEDQKLTDFSGYHDGTINKIVIRAADDYNPHQNAIADYDVDFKRTIRHELIHAFFEQSGLPGYSENEQLVDWFATQMPKILEVVNEVEGL